MGTQESQNATVIEPAVEGVAVHALHKSASMFLYKFFQYVSRQQGFEFYSANNQPPNELLSEQPKGKFCCCPLRTFKFGDDANDDSDIVRIFHVRDPRDMLVSEYFSFGWSHSTGVSGMGDRREEIQDMSIDDYVIEQPNFSNWPLEKKFAPLMERDLDSHREILVKYETMVTRFPEWAAKVIGPFRYRIPKLAVAKLAWKYRNEFKPSVGDSHRRSVTPGDHRRKLQPATIEILNDRFAAVLSKFGYED